MSTQIIVSGAPVNQANSVIILVGNTRTAAYTTNITPDDVQDFPNYLTNPQTSATGINGTFGSGLVNGPQLLVNGIQPSRVIVDKSINTSVADTQVQLQNGEPGLGQGPAAGTLLTRDGRWYDGNTATYYDSKNFVIGNGAVKNFGNDNAATNGWNTTQVTIINNGGQATGIVT